MLLTAVRAGHRGFLCKWQLVVPHSQHRFESDLDVSYSAFDFSDARCSRRICYLPKSICVDNENCLQIICSKFELTLKSLQISFLQDMLERCPFSAHLTSTVEDLFEFVCAILNQLNLAFTDLKGVADGWS